MTLTRTIDTASSGIGTNAQRSAVAAQNIARVNQQGASRKIVNLVTVPGAGVRVSSIVRAVDEGLRDVVLAAGSDLGAKRAQLDALDAMSATLGDTEAGRSPAGLIAELASSLQLYASSPQNPAGGRAVVLTAQRLASGLNEASRTVADLVRKADTELAGSVAKVNDILSTFKDINDQIVNGTIAGAEITDLEDTRDELLKQLSDEIGIRANVRGNNDMVIQTDSGVTLFERVPRTVTFQPNAAIVPGQASNPVYVDGVPVTLASGGMPISGGRIAGLARVSDEIAPVFAKQLDEIARGLIVAFSESDQSAAPTLPDVPGLFTYSGAPAIPTIGAASIGLAGAIRVNANVDPDQGGDVNRLRDGGVGAPGVAQYVYNTEGGAGYAGRLQGLLSGLGAKQSFDPSSSLQPSATLSEFASDSAAWVESSRKAATSEVEYRSTILEKSKTSLSNATGVNLDDEVTAMLDIERSYQASAKVLSVVDRMLENLMNAIR